MNKEIMSDVIYGSTDGVITTVAILGSVIGAEISKKYGLIIGIANLISDGFSMGVSRLNSSERKDMKAYIGSLVTFVSFVTIGIIPLTGILISNNMKSIIIMSVISFIIIGLIKGIYERRIMRSVIESVILGGSGASVSYVIANKIKKMLV
jgi:VIT1/CCC1 family predicted Fe2+/Mn2+ transporter